MGAAAGADSLGAVVVVTVGAAAGSLATGAGLLGAGDPPEDLMGVEGERAVEALLKSARPVGTEKLWD